VTDDVYCSIERRYIAFDRARKSRTHSSAGERSLHTGEVQGSIPCASTTFDLPRAEFTSKSFYVRAIAGSVPMTPQKLVVLFTSLTGGAIGLFAPIGAVKWLLQTEPEDAGILTLFFFPVWCLLVVAGLLAGRKLGLLVTGGKRVLQR
jgi:hypothetical protein